MLCTEVSTYYADRYCSPIPVDTYMNNICKHSQGDQYM